MIFGDYYLRIEIKFFISAFCEVKWNEKYKNKYKIKYGNIAFN